MGPVRQLGVGGGRMGAGTAALGWSLALSPSCMRLGDPPLGYGSYQAAKDERSWSCFQDDFWEFIRALYWFDTISNPLLHDLSEVVLIHLLMTKTKKKVVFRSKVVLIIRMK